MSTVASAAITVLPITRESRPVCGTVVSPERVLLTVLTWVTAP